jgi:hypothetical protein
MKTSKTLITGFLMLGLLCLSGIAAAQEDSTATDISGTILLDDIQPYDGPIDAGSPLYGLKIAFEDMDESFTSNQTERVDKQMSHARLRIAEVRRALELNQSDSAQEALDNYWQKMNLTQFTLSMFRSNTTGLLHAQEQITRHQFVLEKLLLSHPNNTGLWRAYNNSLRLEEKFSEKTAIKFNRTMEKNNQTIIKAIRLELKEMERHGNTTQPDHTQEQQIEREKNGNRNAGSQNTTQVTTRPTRPMTEKPQQDRPSDTKQNGNSGNPDNKGKINSPDN